MRTKLIVGVCLGFGGAFAGCAAADDSKEPIADTKQATSPCDLSAPFKAPEKLIPEPADAGPFSEFTTLDFDGLTFSANGGKMYLSSPHLVTTSYDIMRSDLTGAAYDDTHVVDDLSTPNNDDRAPFLRADGNTLYMHRVVSGYNDIFYATLDGGSEFANPAPLTAVNTALHDQDPFYLEANDTLFFASERSPNNTIKDIYYLSGSTIYQLPTGNTAVNRADTDEYRPVLTSDGLTLYFASKRPGIGGDTDGDIWTSTRASLDDPFGTPTRLDILNRSGRDFPVAISPDNCTLYLASNQDTGLGGTDHYRLYKATRMEEVEETVTLTLKIKGTGSVTTSPFNCSHTGSSDFGGTGTCSANLAPGTVQQIDASSSSTWSGSCTGFTSPDSNGLAVWAEGGTCYVTIL